jgi:hypothetical protein
MTREASAGVTAQSLESEMINDKDFGFAWLLYAEKL